MKIRGKAWCAHCDQERTVYLFGLSIQGSNKVVEGYCSVCERPVQRKVISHSQKTEPNPPQDNSCILVPHPQKINKKINREPTSAKASVLERSRDAYEPSLITLAALFSFCLVITYLL